MIIRILSIVAACMLALALRGEADEPGPRAFVDGSGPGFVLLGKDDFEDVNCGPDTWTFEEGMIHCTGTPTGVIRTKKQYANFELVVEWMHKKPGGNSGIFVWGIPESMKDLKPGGLPHGIECQVLDNAFKTNYERDSGKKADWFTTHGDVFAVGQAKMKPFPPLSPNGSRSFPTKELSKDAGQWNHYYIRAINGEVRLWVNGEEVSGGNECQPATGYICLESEGSPIDFRGLSIRELP
jgi:hypothetical protein